MYFGRVIFVIIEYNDFARHAKQTYDE